MLADWYLKFHQDRDTARETLQRIIERFPDLEMSNLAAQRNCEPGEHGTYAGGRDRKKFTVVEGMKNLGLLDSETSSRTAGCGCGKTSGGVGDASPGASTGCGGAGKVGDHLCGSLPPDGSGHGSIGPAHHASESTAEAGGAVAE